MAGIFLYSFDWDLFQKALGPPASELARRIAGPILKERKHSPDAYAGFPASEPDLVADIAAQFEAEDWYEGKSYDEKNRMDTLVHMLFFSPSIQKRALKVKVLGDSAGLEVYALAQGQLEVDPTRGVVRHGRYRGTVYFRPAQREPVGLVELPSLGARPHRHARWDRTAALREVGAMWGGLGSGEPTQPAYWPIYSIHSPEQVALLFEELSNMHESLRDVLAGAPGVREQFESGLLGPVETAAKGKQALYASVDT